MSFQNGVEFRITIDGESWMQGDSIRGKIESKPNSKAQVFLAEGADKKVKSKSADAFLVLKEIQPDHAPFEWTFDLPMDTRISDKSGALYVLYGHGEHLEKLGQLRLNILPHIHFKDLIELFTHHFRFALKTISAGKNHSIDVKLDPPSSKEWSMLEQALLHLRISNDTLEAKFSFHRKEVDASQGGLATKSVKREFLRNWKISSITHAFNQRIDKDILTAEIEKVIAEYRDAGWLSS